MERRRFLAAGVAVSGAFALRSLRAQPAMTRAAVVIGVDKAGSMPKLRAAKSGAQAVAQWLQGESFDVKLFVDEAGPVRASDLFNAISAFVNRGTLDQLVVYFAGHGFISGSLSEFWMLSDAPENPNEAVSLTESCVYAEQSGIPNVVFISDACRSRADSLSIQRVHGSVVFPNPSTAHGTSEVDQFLATRVGAAAYEVSVDQSVAAFSGIYTDCFLEAFKRPYPTMVQTVDGKPVIPNRRLKAYLAAEVPKRAQHMSITLDQHPDSKIYSDEPTYIGHVLSAERTAASSAAPTVADVANFEIWGERGPGVTGPPVSPGPELMATKRSSGFGEAQSAIIHARGVPNEFVARSGFTVTGQHVKSVVTRPGIKAHFANSTTQDRPSSLIETDVREAGPASVAVRFAEGSGTVLAALNDYIGNVVVDERGVRNVSYVPSRESPYWSIYQHEGPRLDQLRASVATAAEFGVFRFEGPKETRRQAASQMADKIRVLKGIDPTLGIYAAYAYAEAGLPEKVHSVSGYMRSDLGTDLFDVAMLSGALSGGSSAGRAVPFCPMLSQGWALLRAKNVRLHESVADVRDFLRVSLWLSLSDAGMSIVESALSSGKLR